MLWAPSCFQFLEEGEDVLAYCPTRQPRDQRVSQDQIFWELPAPWEGFWVWSGTTGKTETTAGHKKGVQWKCLVVTAISRSGVLLVQNSYPGDHLVMWISSTGYCCRVVLLLQGEAC